MCRPSARILRAVIELIAITLLVACSGGASTTPPPGTLQSTRYSLGGTVSGLSGAGLVLQSNTGEKLAARNGTFTFQTTLTTGTSYYVVVAAQPGTPTQSCSIANGTGTIGAANVADVVVSCEDKTTNMDSVGGVVVGAQGPGLVLQNNRTDNLTVTSSGAFSFPTQLPANSPYSVSVLSPPLDPYQDCIVTNSPGTTGASDVANVVVSCTVNSNPKHTISVTVQSVTGTITLQNNGRDSLTVSSPGTYPFSIQIPTGSPYKVIASSVKGVQSESCTFQNGSGVVGGSDIDVVVNCAPAVVNDPITASVSGLSGTLVLEDNGGDNLSVTQNGLDTFATALPSGTTYKVTVFEQPTNQTCTVSNGTGTAGGTAPPPAVTCTNILYPVSGMVAGLLGTDSVILQDNGGDSLTVSANGPFTFLTRLISGTPYDVTVFTQPLILGETCSVANATGTANTTGTAPAVTCVPNPNTISVTVSGLGEASSVVLQDNGGDNLTVARNGSFAFATQLLSGTAYNVTVLRQPGPGQTCTVANGTGTAGSSSPAPTVTCVINYAPISGTVTGLQGSGLVLQDDGSDNLSIAGNGPFTFPIKLAVGTPYNVTVLTQPTNPAQTCTVANGTGSAGGAGATPVVTCAFTLGVTVNGLNPNEQGGSLVLQNNNGDKVTVALAGPYSANFPTLLASGANYSVTVVTQPGTDTSGGLGLQTSVVCVVSNGSGTITNSNVSVTVNCVQPIGFAYVTNSLESTVSAYLVDQSGALLASGGPAVATGSAPSGAAVDYTNSFLYVTNRGSNDLSIYTIDPNTGALTAAVAGPPPAILAPTAPATIARGYSANDLYLTGADTSDSIVYVVRANGTSLVNAEKPILLSEDVPTADTALVAALASVSPNLTPITTYYYLAANPSVNSLYAYPIDSSLLLSTTPSATTSVGSTPTSVAALTFTYPAGTPYAGNTYSTVYVANSGDGTITSYTLSEENANLLTPAVCKIIPAIAKSNARLAQTSLTSNSTQMSFVLGTDSTQLYAYQATPDACLAEVTGSRPFASGATPGPLATFNVNPSVNPTLVYAVDVGGTTAHVFALGPNGLTPVLQQGNPATATTGKAPSSIVVNRRPALGG